MVPLRTSGAQRSSSQAIKPLLSEPCKIVSASDGVISISKIFPALNLSVLYHHCPLLNIGRTGIALQSLLALKQHLVLGHGEQSRVVQLGQ